MGDAGGDDRKNAVDTKLFSCEKDQKRCEHFQQHVQRDILHSQPANPLHKGGFCYRKHEPQQHATKRNDEKAQAGRFHGKRTRHHRRYGELEGDKTGSVIDQRFPSQNMLGP
ncbi:hypothetical protein D3C81_260660 [compost metagenome]